MGKIIVDSNGLQANAKSLANNADLYDTELAKIKAAVEKHMLQMRRANTNAKVLEQLLA